MHRAHLRFLGALFLTVRSSCWDQGPPAVGGVEIDVAVTTMVVDDSVLVSAYALSTAGERLSRRVGPPAITSSDPRVVSASGTSIAQAVALGPGTAYLVARYRDFADSARITVTARD